MSELVTPHIRFDTGTAQLVIAVSDADDEGEVELLRLDIRQLTADDKQRLRHVRDPDREQPPPGDTPATRR